MVALYFCFCSLYFVQFILIGLRPLDKEKVDPKVSTVRNRGNEETTLYCGAEVNNLPLLWYCRSLQVNFRNDD